MTDCDQPSAAFHHVASNYLVQRVTGNWRPCVRSYCSTVLAKCLHPRETRKQKELRALSHAWGSAVDRDRVFSLYEEFASKSSLNVERYVDDHTWKDLGMNEVYSCVDRTLSSPGEFVLYERLRLLEADGQLLEQRDRYVTCLQENEAFRFEVQLLLGDLGRCDAIRSVLDLLDGKAPSHRRIAVFYRLLVCIVIATVLLPLLGMMAYGVPWQGSLLLFGVCFYPLCLYIHYRTRTAFGYWIDGLRYIGSMVTTARRLGVLKGTELSETKDKLATASETCACLPRKLIGLHAWGNGVLSASVQSADFGR